MNDQQRYTLHPDALRLLESTYRSVTRIELTDGRSVRRGDNGEWVVSLPGASGPGVFPDAVMAANFGLVPTQRIADLPDATFTVAFDLPDTRWAPILFARAVDFDADGATCSIDGCNTTAVGTVRWRHTDPAVALLAGDADIHVCDSHGLDITDHPDLYCLDDFTPETRDTVQHMGDKAARP